MQSFQANSTYNCIVLRYCIGYLNADDLVLFLRKIGTMLSNTTSDCKRMCQKESYIVIPD